MKGLNYLPIILIVFSICCGKKETKVEEKQRIQDKELKSGVIIDTIFLGLKFGMTEQEYEEHCYRLRQLGKIEQIGKMYAYKLQGLTEEYVCFFGPEYFEGKMYKLIVVTTPRIAMGAVNKFVQLALEKYSPQTTTDESMKQYSDCPRYEMHKGNLEIDIFCNVHGEAIMHYIDNRISAKVKTSEDSLKNETNKKSVKDF